MSGHVIFACSDGVLTAGQSLSKSFVVGKCPKVTRLGKEFVAIPRVFANCVSVAAKPFPSQGGVTRFQAVQRPEKKLKKLLDTS